jgi:hypothetical protein
VAVTGAGATLRTRATTRSPCRVAWSVSGDCRTATSTDALRPGSVTASTSYAPATASRPSTSNSAACDALPAGSAASSRYGAPCGSCRNARARPAMPAVATLAMNGRAVSARKNERRTAPCSSGVACRSVVGPAVAGAGSTTVATSRNAGPRSVSSDQASTVPVCTPGESLAAS